MSATTAEIVHDFTAEAAATYAGMVAAIGTAIVSARAADKPDPTDDELRLTLALAGFHPVDIRRWFALAKQEATNA